MLHCFHQHCRLVLRTHHSHPRHHHHSRHHRRHHHRQSLHPSFLQGCHLHRPRPARLRRAWTRSIAASAGCLIMQPSGTWRTRGGWQMPQFCCTFLTIGKSTTTADITTGAHVRLTHSPNHLVIPYPVGCALSCFSPWMQARMG